MKIEFDPQKDAANFDKHGLRFEDVDGLDWNRASVALDDRHEYGEPRYRAFVYALDGNGPYNIVFTMRGDVMRVISFRRAREKERKRHEKNTH